MINPLIPNKPWFVPDNNRSFSKQRLKVQHGVAKDALARHIKACHAGSVSSMEDCAACRTIKSKVEEEEK